MPPASRGPAEMPVRSVNPTMRAMSLIIPGFLVMSVGYALYVVPDYILMEQFFRTYHSTSLALGLLIPYAVIATLMVACYVRTFITVRNNPGVVPLGPEYARNFYGNKNNASDATANEAIASSKPSRTNDFGDCSRAARERRRLRRQGFFGRRMNNSNSTAKVPLDRGQPDLEPGLANSVPYDGGDARYGNPQGAPDPRLDPDSPGLELFYTKDVFECTADGRPIWCSQCGTWKPDRTHHCSEINRCVRKMDHYCPWVGGIVSETAFKFFVQFNIYATLLCALTIATCAYALWRRNSLGLGSDARIIVMLVLGCFLGMFTSAIMLTSTHFVFANLTTVESHQVKDRVKMMAVRIQQGSPPVEGRYGVVTYPLPKDNALGGYNTIHGAPNMNQHHRNPDNGGGRRDPLPMEHGVVSNGTVGSEAAAAGAAEGEEEDPFKIARQARAARRAARDQLAFRTFAIIPLERGMNVWDLGWRQNWVSVMGTNLFDWILPVRSSPCCNHESTHSFYRLSPKFRQLCANLSLPLPPSPEMEQVPPHW